MQRKARYFPRRINNYVPALAYAADIIIDGPHEVRFGPMALANTTKFLVAQDMTVAGSATLGGANALLVDNTDPVVAAYQIEFPYGPGFGRNVQVVASGASVVVVTVRGRDYLGQPMTETLTMNGATPVLGLKCFKYIDSITWPASAVNLSFGTGVKFGLPYRMKNAINESSDGVAAAAGTLTTPVLTDPGTAATGEPRGAYTPTTTPDGTKYLTATFIPNRDVNAAGNGGLYGIAHFYS